MSPKKETILTHTVSVVTKQNGSLPGLRICFKEIARKTKKEIKKSTKEGWKTVVLFLSSFLFSFQLFAVLESLALIRE